MQIVVPQEISFVCPEGTLSATFYHAKEISKMTKRGEEKLVRLLFQPDTLSTEARITLVGRNFVPSLARGSELRTFLDLWLGSDFVNEHKQRGTFDFAAVQDRAADLVVKHINNEGYNQPFVYLAAAYPPGTLKTESPKEQPEEE